jgi:transmembrane sensor
MESREQAEEAAAHWLARRHSEDWAAADDAALAQWLDAVPGNRVAYLRLSLGWQKAGRLTAFGAGVPRGVVPTPEQMQASPYFDRQQRTLQSPVRPRNKRRLYAIAASLAMMALLGTTWHFINQGPTYRTEIGGLESVPLVDGSKVTLNTNSAIRLAVTDSERRVDLKQGEAYFEVAKDPDRPFIVVAGKQRVVAVGTKFSVRRGDRDDFHVVVTEGRVRIERLDSITPATEVPAGRIATGGGEGVLIQDTPYAEVERTLSWRSGYLSFQDTALADAVADFNRYNTRQLVIEDPHVAGIRIDGNFRATSVDMFVRLLEGGFPVTAEQRGDRIVLKPR